MAQDAAKKSIPQNEKEKNNPRLAENRKALPGATELTPRTGARWQPHGPLTTATPS